MAVHYERLFKKKKKKKFKGEKQNLLSDESFMESHMFTEKNRCFYYF